MSLQCAAPFEPPCDDALTGVAGGWARGMLDRELVVLGELAEVGLAIAKAMERQVVEVQVTAPAKPAAPAPVFGGDIALAYFRVSRAVRMTVALQARLIGELQQLEKDEAREARSAASDARSARDAVRRERKARVARVLTRIIEAEAYPEGEAGADDAAGPEAEDAEARATESYERLINEATECLKDRDRFGDVLTRPVSEFIDLVCRDLGLSPDWPRLAQEAWAQEEIRSGKVGAPLTSISSPARGGGGPAQPVEGALRRRNVPSVTALARRATSPAGGGGKTSTSTPDYYWPGVDPPPP